MLQRIKRLKVNNYLQPSETISFRIKTELYEKERQRILEKSGMFPPTEKDIKKIINKRAKRKFIASINRANRRRSKMGIFVYEKEMAFASRLEKLGAPAELVQRIRDWVNQQKGENKGQ
jgi:hypothetical protein